MTTPNSAVQPLTIDIWSDIACPWCYLGQRRLAEGLNAFAAFNDAVPVEIEYHSFELAPDTPEDFEGSEMDFLAHHKGMGQAQVEQMLGQMTELATAEGVEFNFDTVAHTKTLRAHELLHHAKSVGLQSQMLTRLFAAYFTEGEHIARPEVLAKLAADVGLDPAEVTEVLAESRYADAVAADIARAQAIGVTGVPFYVIDGRYGISGAQSPQTFTAVLTQVITERQGATS